MEHFTKMKTAKINDKVEKKNGLDYLPWADAWKATKEIYPDAIYEIKRFENNLPYVYDEKTGYMCFTSVTIEGITHEMWLPVMDYKNNAKMNASMTDINKTIMRCLTKNLAMFGMGLALYTGEDLPEEEKEPVVNQKWVDGFTKALNENSNTIEQLEEWWKEAQIKLQSANMPTRDECLRLYTEKKEELDNE